MNEGRRAFHTLDGLRGVAALIVVTRHAEPLADRLQTGMGFLAVDLFFLLSGFVIAYAYGRRLEAGGFIRRFFLIRLIRLYPLFLLGIGIGVLYRAFSVMAGTGGWSVSSLAASFGLAIFMIPEIPAHLGAIGLDTPTWTLLPELLANGIYAIFVRRLGVRALCVVVALGAIGLVWSEIHYGTLDVVRLYQWPATLARLTFSFFLGVLIFKLLGDRRASRPITSWICVAVTAVALVLVPPGPIMELVLVMLAFPAIVVVAAQCEPADGRLFRFLGVVSYAVYTLHQPMAALLVRAATVAHLHLPEFAFWPFLAMTILVAWAAVEIYDAPLRRWLTNRLPSMLRHWLVPK